VPAAGDQTAEGAVLGGGVDVERLRVEPGCEVDDVVLGDGDAVVFIGRALCVVLEVAVIEAG
jgi:hypothetical protein